jgi:hypothetical protein
MRQLITDALAESPFRRAPNLSDGSTATKPGGGLPFQIRHRRLQPSRGVSTKFAGQKRRAFAEDAAHTVAKLQQKGLDPSC